MTIKKDSLDCIVFGQRTRIQERLLYIQIFTIKIVEVRQING